MPHAGWADAAERQAILRDVHQRFVHAHASGERGLQHALLLRAGVGEQVEREREGGGGAR